MKQEVVEKVVTSVDPVIIEYWYWITGEHIAIVLVALAIAVILFRFGNSFYQYIYTGEFGDTDDCFIFQFVEEHEINRYALLGTHPLTIILDGLVFGLLAGLSYVLWAPMLGLGGIILLGYLLRQKIAKKQDFVAKLEGTHPDLSA